MRGFHAAFADDGSRAWIGLSDGAVA